MATIADRRDTGQAKYLVASDYLLSNPIAPAVRFGNFDGKTHLVLGFPSVGGVLKCKWEKDCTFPSPEPF